MNTTHEPERRRTDPEAEAEQEEFVYKKVVYKDFVTKPKYIRRCSLNTGARERWCHELSMQKANPKSQHGGSYR